MRQSAHFDKRQGYSLIELMVGITLGMLGLIAVTEIFIHFNRAKTVQSSLVESQSNGAMAIFLMERDIDRAGYGMMPLQSCGCTYLDQGGVLQHSLPTDNPPAPSYCQEYPNSQNPGSNLVKAILVAPILITDGGVNGSDSIFIQYGTPGGGVDVNQILSTSSFGGPLNMKSIGGMSIGDKIVLNHNSGQCAVWQVTGLSSANQTVSTNFNEGVNPVGPGPSPAAAEIGYPSSMNQNEPVINLGQMVSKNFLVNALNAQLQENTAPTYANNSSIVENIVYMKADLGRDINGDKLADIWDKPTATTIYGATGGYSNIVAIRIGVVARTQAMDRSVPSPSTLVVLPAITGGTEQDYTVPDTNYRYSVYYTVIPMRNMMWN
jgi:type IV pilus assembly protein PilW